MRRPRAEEGLAQVPAFPEKGIRSHSGHPSRHPRLRIAVREGPQPPWFPSIINPVRRPGVCWLLRPCGYPQGAPGPLDASACLPASSLQPVCVLPKWLQDPFTFLPWRPHVSPVAYTVEGWLRRGPLRPSGDWHQLAVLTPPPPRPAQPQGERSPYPPQNRPCSRPSAFRSKVLRFHASHCFSGLEPATQLFAGPIPPLQPGSAGLLEGFHTARSTDPRGMTSALTDGLWDENLLRLPHGGLSLGAFCQLNLDTLDCPGPGQAGMDSGLAICTTEL